MNGFIKRAFSIVCVGGAAALGGCTDCKLCNLYDNCWVDRWSYQASESVKQIFDAQAGNGHVLEQTIYTHDFEPGTEKLTRSGIDRLAYLVRRRPAPDTKIYLQTAHDVEYDPSSSEKYASVRSELDAKRIQAIQKFLNADTAGRGLAFEVTAIDVPTPGIPARPIMNALQKNYQGFQGSLPVSQPTGSAVALPPPNSPPGTPAPAGIPQ
jgi:hypothetical protein